MSSEPESVPTAGAAADPSPAATEADAPGREQRERRVVMLARSGLNEALAAKVLPKAGMELEVRPSGEEVAAEIERGAGALLVSAEALTPGTLEPLLAVLAHQPPWSDLPVVALPGDERTSNRWTSGALERLGNVIVLERPVRNAMLLSAVRSALRDRGRQYEFRALLSRLDEVERRRHEFLVELGHEVRNPLGVIRTALSLLEELDGGADPAERARPVELIARQTEILARLVDDLLHVSRFNVGQIALQPRTVDLAEVVETTLERFSLTAKAKGGRLDLRLDDAAVPVAADAVSLEQVVFHLVRAALRDAPPGDRVELAVGSEDGRAVLTVDGSRPADPEAEPELAQALPIVRNLVELHGGRVDSTADGAAVRVVVRLPRRQRPERRRGRDRRRRGRPLSVLVVEDSSDGREGLKTLLELKSYRVATAADGGQALARADESAPEVALVDIGLPDMDGYEVARQLRARFGSAPLLVAMTGYGQPDDRRRALEAGFDLHLVKPVDPEQLFDLLAGAGEAPAASQGS